MSELFKYANRERTNELILRLSKLDKDKMQQVESLLCHWAIGALSMGDSKTAGFFFDRMEKLLNEYETKEEKAAGKEVVGK